MKPKRSTGTGTHLTAHPGDQRALCGVTHPMPVMHAPHAPTHAYNHPRCTGCYTHAGLTWMLTPDPQPTLFEHAS